MDAAEKKSKQSKENCAEITSSDSQSNRYAALHDNKEDDVEEQKKVASKSMLTPEIATKENKAK